MQFTTLALSAATCAMAAPSAPQSGDQPTLNPDLAIFTVTTQEPGGELQANGWGAMQKGIFTGDSPQLGASCMDSQYHQFATFVLNKAEGTLSLYTDGKPWQQLYVDRSGMGQGLMAYTTGAEPAPRNAERTGWAIDENRYLSFGGSGKFVACPGGPNSSFRVLPYVGIENPAGYSNCTEITALTITSIPDPKAADPKNPVQCYYTTE